LHRERHAVGLEVQSRQRAVDVRLRLGHASMRAQGARALASPSGTSASTSTSPGTADKKRSP
jgi:hypothetical protein